MEVVPPAPAAQTGHAKAPRLADLYAPCLTLVAQLRAVAEFGEARALRDRANDLLDRARSQALDAGMPPGDVQDAAFAVVASLDEAVQASTWSKKDEWLARPLQLEHFDRYDAGEEFFARLETLRTDPAATAHVLEVYYLCLALGFEGRYQLQEEKQRRLLIENTYAELRRVERTGSEALSPHARPGDRATVESRSRRLAGAITAVLVVFLAALVYLSMSLYISHVAVEAGQAIQTVQREQAAPAPWNAPVTHARASADPADHSL